MPALASLVEIKRTLAGAEKRFACRLLAGNDRRVVALWIAPEAMHVHGVDLPAGTISFGHFWTDRFYNVYHWVDANGRTLGFYFNLADSTRIGAEQLEWRDLVVDVLMTPDGVVRMLDEDELPPNLDDETASHVAAGRQALLAAPAAIRAEVEAGSRALYPLVFPEPV